MNSIVIASIKRQIVSIYHDPKFCVSSPEIHFFFYFKQKNAFGFALPVVRVFASSVVCYQRIYYKSLRMTQTHWHIHYMM